MNQTHVDIARHKIQPLNSTNYSVWSKKMKLLPRGKSLWNIVSGMETDPGETDTAAMAVYGQRRDVARTDIILSIENRCSHAVINLDNPKLVWNKLQEMYKGVSDACFDTYLERLHKLEMQDSETVMEYVNKLVEVENDLAGVGHLLYEKEEIRALLRGLREDFEVTAKAIRVMNMSFTKAASELVVEEGSRTLQNGEASDRPSTALSTIQHDEKCSHCEREDHNVDQCFHNPRSKGYKKDFRKKKGRMNNRRSSNQKSKHTEKKQGD